MNLGVSLKNVEKVFGPALPGRASPEKTLSAMRFAAGKGKKFAGVLGIHPDAQFYIYFPLAIKWELLKTAKGVPDFINDLQESGPQGEQDREKLVAKFLDQHTAVERLANFVGEQNGKLVLGSESFSLKFKISKDAKNKFKIVASL